MAIMALAVWAVIRLWRNGRRIESVVLGLVSGLLIVGYGLPIVMIARNLSYGRQVKEELLASLRARYPQRDFHLGVGYQRPDIYVHVPGEVDDIEQDAIREFLVAESMQRNFDANVWLLFDAPDGQDEIRHKIHGTQ